MAVCKKTFIPIPSNSHFVIPIPILMNKTYPFPFPWDSRGTHGTAGIPVSCSPLLQCQFLNGMAYRCW